MNYCDGDHATQGEVRLLPYGNQGGNVLVCREHFEVEMRYRQECKMDKIVKWDSLKVYEVAE